MNESSSAGLFAVVTSLGASHRGGDGLRVLKCYEASLLLCLVSRQLSNRALLITTSVAVLFIWCQSWGAQTGWGLCLY